MRMCVNSLPALQLLLLLHLANNLLLVMSRSMNMNEMLEEREKIIARERSTTLGQDQTLTPEEEAVNKVLMDAKQRELLEARRWGLDFLPATNFLAAREQVEASHVYKIIQRMPKGAELHIHTSALNSVAWVVSELTYWPHLYMCHTHNHTIRLKFFLEPDETCGWQLVQEVRDSYPSPEEFDAFLLNSVFPGHGTAAAEMLEHENSIWELFERTVRSLKNILRYRPALEAYLYRALHRYMQDGILYLELRTTLSPLYELNGTQLTIEETIRVFDSTIKHFILHHSHSFYGARLIYSVHRYTDNETVKEHVGLVQQLKAQFPDLMAGFDLVGQEDKGVPLKQLLEPLLMLADTGIPVFYHAGETAWMGMSSDENVIDALLLNATRLGHGYALAKHPMARKMVMEKKVGVEVCPISNQMFGLLHDLRNHPAATMASEGFPLILSSDGLAFWGAEGLSYDFYMAFMLMAKPDANLRFIKQLIINSIMYSTLDDQGKSALLSMWVSKWEEFIASEMATGSTLSLPSLVLTDFICTVFALFFINSVVISCMYICTCISRI